MKIVIGTHEYCGIVSGLQKGFEKLGHEVKSVIKKRGNYFNSKVYSIDLSNKSLGGKILHSFPIGGARIEQFFQTRKYKSVFNHVLNSDFFVYIWDSLLPDLKDIIELKRQGKKIFFLFIGSDVRFAPAFTQQFPEINIPWSDYYIKEDINRKLFYIRTIEKYVDAIFSVPDQSGLQIRPFYHMHLPLDVDSILFHYPDNEIPEIVHVPSNRALKGTELIIRAMEECKKRNLKFNFKIIENQPNLVVKEELQNTDIVIDQIYTNGPGMLGIEAMASGNALATKFLESYNAFKPPVCYIDHTDILVSNMEKLIMDREYRREIAYNGRKFVEQNNDIIKIAERMLSIYDGKVSELDFYPTFFEKDFHLPEYQKLNKTSMQLNKEILSKCSASNHDFNSLSNRGLI